MKYLNETGLARLWEHISNGLDAKANLTHTHETDDIEYFREDVTSIITGTKISSLKTADSSLTLTDNNIEYDLDNVGTGVLALDRDLVNKVDKVSGKGLSTNDYTTTEKNKLAGIASGAEVNVQANWTQTTTTADDYIKNKPNLATVATSGSYNDLSNKPTIPPAITIDSALSSTSTNPVQNKVINTALNGKVPTTRKVNGKALSSDVTLGSADILVAGDRTIDDAFSSVNTSISNLRTSKQDTLVSGTNIKTINNEPLLGSGNITIQGGGDPSAITDARIEEICDLGGGFTITFNSVVYTGGTWTFNLADGSSQTAQGSSFPITVNNVVSYSPSYYDTGIQFEQIYSFTVERLGAITAYNTSNVVTKGGTVYPESDMTIINTWDDD